MAVNKKISVEIPEDAVILSPEEAYAFQMKIIRNWKPQKEVWSLVYTPGFLGAIGSASGIYVNSHFRRKLKLGKFGLLSTYLPIVVLPALLTTTIHKGIIQKSIILDTETCPICTQLRSGAFQIGFGIIYPTVLAPFAALMFATRHFTFRLPSITEKPKEVFMLIRKMTKPLVPFVIASIIGQSLIAMFLTYQEMFQFYKIQEKLQAIESRIESELVR